ncbi:hypothetical protein [Acetobacter orleanensis]|uniref:hypothetical protein n=1 Tax=Acetobacter orleanensis TaxID=104099 RepID=UPI001144C2CB|nr:hypothetical protein [Acetobacter orleanensis]
MTNAAILRLVSKSVMHVSFSAVLVGLSGCGYYASRTAHEAQVTMIGMTEEDVQACAGIPTKTQVINNRVKILEYQRGRNIGAPTTSTLIPVQSVVNVVRDIGGGDGNVCIADFRIVDGKVSDVYYSGDNDMLVGTDGVCSSVVRGCVRRNVPSGSPSDFWKTSAFLQPQPAATHPAATPPDATVVAPPFAAPETISGAAPASPEPTLPSSPASTSAPNATPTSPSSAAPSSVAVPAIAPVKAATPDATPLSGAVPQGAPPAELVPTVTNTTPVVAPPAKTVPTPPAVTQPAIPSAVNPAPTVTETPQK